jgi:hypothetical protein
MSEQDTHPFRARDAASLLILGGFFVFLGLLVSIGTFWTEIGTRASVVNLSAGALLIAVGVCMGWVGQRMRHAGASPRQGES